MRRSYSLRQAAFLRRFADRFPLAKEVKHHHRMREQRNHRAEDADRDVLCEHAVARRGQAEIDGRDNTGDRRDDRREECRRQPQRPSCATRLTRASSSN